MGLDYRYLLFFERAAELDVLRHLAAIARTGREVTMLEVPAEGEMPYRTLTLPFEAWAGTPSHLWLDMGGWASGVDRDVVLFELGTTGTRMSTMFSDSESVRSVMVRLLEECRGVCGVFDREDYGVLFWWRGRELEEELPAAELDLAEIERFVPPGLVT